MKCPKCGYLGFERVERCRNCGYDFSLTKALPIPDLPIRSTPSDDPFPLSDLALSDPTRAGAPGATPQLQQPLDRGGGPAPELPLFGSNLADDVPLITTPSPPRTPLAVRRSTPEVSRLRTETRAATLDFAPSDESRPAISRTPTTRSPRRVAEERPAARQSDTATVMSRVFAILIDLVVLAAIDATVVYFTMQIVGVTFAELTIVPKLPLIAFLVLQNVAYFIAFTAGGQTLGQMAFGIKVVSEPGGGSPDLGRSIVRTLVWVVLAAPAGLGLITALFSDGRGLHDRFAGTRVIRASA